LGRATITGASLTFTKIANWDNNANRLFIHLLDTAKFSGVRSFIDAAGVPVTNIADNFAGSLLASNPLVASGTGNTLLTSRSFSMTSTTYIYNFSAAQLRALQGYIANGNNLAFSRSPRSPCPKVEARSPCWGWRLWVSSWHGANFAETSSRKFGCWSIAELQSKSAFGLGAQLHGIRLTNFPCREPLSFLLL
jgi:hypothetical protein